MAEEIRPMLAFPSVPFDSKDHIFEIKWDGTRCILYLEGERISLKNRRLLDITRRYPELSTLKEEIKARKAIIDGEIVVFSSGRTDFSRLEVREHASGPMRIELLSKTMPATYVAFDLLFLDGDWLVDRPLIERRAALSRLLCEHDLLLESFYVEERGKSLFEIAVGKGFEGIMAKKKDSPYLPGRRSRYWLKIKPRFREVCYILGFKRGKGGRDVGSLLVATKRGEDLLFRGSVSSGIGAREMEEITVRLKGLKRQSPCLESLKDLYGIGWVEPRILCEVEFFEITRKGRFRGPVFKGLIDE